MGTPILGRRRHRRGLVTAALLSAVAFGCQPEVVGPGTPEEGPLRIRPVLMSSVDAEALDLDSIDVVIRRTADGTSVREATLEYQADAILAWVLSLDDLPDVLDVEARVRSGTTPMFEGVLEGVQVVEASPASPGVVHDVPVDFVGPGYDAVAVSVEPADPVLGFGQTTRFEAVATNAAGDPISGAILFWTSSDAVLAPVDADGFLTAPDERGAAEVTATTVTGVSGSTSVTFQPGAGEIVVLAGDGAEAPVGGDVTITVQVLGSDGLGLQGVDVGFAAPAGASVSPVSVASGPDGTASTQATLGTLPGPYVFTASAAGVAPVQVTIEAQPGEAVALEIDMNGSTAAPTEPLAPGVTVRVVDAFGNPTPAAVLVALALDANPTGAVLSGTTFAVTVDGVATFADLVVDRHGTGFTLVAESPGLPSVVSTPFDVLQAPASVEVTPTASGLDALGASTTLTAVARDAADDPIVGQTFAWTSSDETVAVVDQAGLVTAVGNGTAVVEAAAGGVSATAMITVEQVVTSVAVSPDVQLLTALDDQVQLGAEARDANGFAVAGVAFVWVSDDDAVAGVDGAGLVTAVANGQAVVRASVGQVSGSATIDVDQAVASVAVSPVDATLASLQEQVQLAAAAFDANGHPVADATFTWTSDVEGVASVSGSGLVTAASNGAAVITAEAGGTSGTAEVTVAQEASAVVVTPPTATLAALGATVALSAEVVDANGFAVPGQTVAWTTPAGGAVTVAADGTVTAAANGVATVTATAGALSVAAEITVAQQVTTLGLTVSCYDPMPPAPVSGSGPALVVPPATCDTLRAFGDQALVTADASDANGFAVAAPALQWTSLAPEVAAVDTAGIVTAIDNGSATIRAEVDGVVSEVEIVVRQVVLAVEVDPAELTLAVYEEAQLAATPVDANGFPVADAAVVWSSENASVASVDAFGLAAGVGPGETYVRATSDGFVGKVSLTVE